MPDPLFCMQRSNKTVSIFQDELSILTVSTVVSFVFGIAGIVFAFLAKSRSVLFDGLYSFVASFFTIISARVVKLVARGDNQEFQFGYGAFEPLLIIIRVLCTLFMYLILGFDAAKTIADGGNEIVFSVAFIYAALSASVCFFFWAALRRAAHRITSPVLIAEAKGWFNDFLLSLSVLSAFLVAYLLQATPLKAISRYADSGITLLMIVCMSPSLVRLFASNMRELVAAAPSQEIQDQLRAIIDGYRAACDFAGFKTYSEKRGRNLYLIVYIVLKHEVPIKSLDKIRKYMMSDIRKWWHQCDCDILFTIDQSWMPSSGEGPEPASSGLDEAYEDATY